MRKNWQLFINAMVREIHNAKTVEFGYNKQLRTGNKLFFITGVRYNRKVFYTANFSLKL
jgi:hypothetical protein